MPGAGQRRMSLDETVPGPSALHLPRSTGDPDANVPWRKSHLVTRRGGGAWPLTSRARTRLLLIRRPRTPVGIGHAGTTVTVQDTDGTFRISLADQISAEVADSSPQAPTRQKVDVSSATNVVGPLGRPVQQTATKPSSAVERAFLSPRRER